MTDEEWGPWIEHDGKGCPDGIEGRFLSVEFRNGHVWGGVYGVTTGKTDKGGPVAYSSGGRSSWRWGTHLPEWDAIRYRIRKPRALQQLREIVENVKEGVEA